MKNTLKPKGSVLIWTVFLGIALAMAFFFFSQRLNFNAAAQAEIVEAQNAELFLESYADYLSSLPFETLKTVAGEIEFEGITGTLGNSTTQIKGVVDVDQTITYHVANGSAKVEWGLCAENEAGRPFTVEPIDSTAASNCAGGYSQVAETKPSTAFNLTAGPAPVSYKITAMEGAVVYDKIWQLKLELKVDSKKTLSMDRAFTPKE